MSDDSGKRFNPPPNWPRPPVGWQPPAGWVPDPSWGAEPEGWPMWVGADKRNWFARHKVLTGLGGGALGLVVLLSTIGAATSGSAEVPDSPRAVTSAAPIVQDTTATGTAAKEAAAMTAQAEADKAAAEKAAAEKAAAKKAAAGKSAAAKAAARKAAAEKAAAARAAKKAAAERAAEAQRSTLPAGTGCQMLADEAVRISAESENTVKIIKVRALKIVKDNRKTFTIPTGSTSSLVLTCRGLAVTSTGVENVPALIRLTVDSDSDYFVEYRGL